MMNIIFSPTAWTQYTQWQTEDKKIIKRIVIMKNKYTYLLY